MDLCTSLGAMRSGLLDVTILGALEVDQHGNIANWAAKREGKWWPGMGGAMELCYGTRVCIATLMHADKKGNSKILKNCTLPSPDEAVSKPLLRTRRSFKWATGI